MNLEHAIQRSTELIVRCLDPEAVVLFGSVAQGRARADSDLDLLVVAHFAEPHGLRALELRGLLDENSPRVDLQLYTPQELADECRNPHSLASTALSHGRWIYARPASAFAFGACKTKAPGEFSRAPLH